MFKLCVFLAVVALAAAKPSLPRFDGRIVGGEDVNIEDYPYQLSLLNNGKHVCGASILSDKFALTAAHCTSGTPVNVWSIRAGSSIRDEGGIVIKVSKLMNHPSFNSNNVDYDMAVLELESSLPFGPGIQPIPLPEYHQHIPVGSQAVTSGWGLISENGPIATHLKAVGVNIIARDVCQEKYGNLPITDRMLCAGVDGGGKDTCREDSGGPLVVAGQLVGVVSWGKGCARPESPGVYADVTELREYIREMTNL